MQVVSNIQLQKVIQTTTADELEKLRLYVSKDKTQIDRLFQGNAQRANQRVLMHRFADGDHPGVPYQDTTDSNFKRKANISFFKGLLFKGAKYVILIFFCFAIIQYLLSSGFSFDTMFD
jgi:hypothetical protein